MASAQVVTLGEAASFGILALEGGSLSINSATQIVGDVGYSNGVSSTTNQKTGTFIGGAYVHSGATFAYTDKNYTPSNGISTGPATDARLNQANADAQAASAQLNLLSPTLSLAFLGDNDSITLNSSGSLNVIDIAGLSYNSDSITLNSRAGFSDTFILRIGGPFDFSQSQVILNGLTADNVLFYFPNATQISINKSASIFEGTIFAPLGTVEYHNPASFSGSIIARHIDLHSDFNLNSTSFIPVPEPSGALLLLASAAASVIRRRRPARNS